MCTRSMTHLMKLVVVLIFVGFSVTSHSAFAQQETLVIGFQDNSTSLDPAIGYTMSSWAMMHNLYDRLVFLEERDLTTPVPGLAESWELDADGRTWTFHLRDDATFSSGNPVTADAVVFSLQRVAKVAGDPAWILTQFGLREDSIRKIDDFTVQIVLDQQYAPTLFLSCLAGPLGGIIDPAAIQAHEQNGDLGQAWLTEHAAGSGPYVLKERVPGERTVLEANEQYWGTPPAFKQVVLKNIQEPLEQMLLLQQGEIDIAWNLQPDHVNALSTDSTIQIFQNLAFSITYFYMNAAYEPFSKPEVRQAIRYAVDYDAIIHNVFQGAAIKMQGFIPKGLLGYTPELPYSYDIEKARQLLAEAGYADGFEVQLHSLGYSPWMDMAMLIKQQLAEIGIQIKIIAENPDEHLATLTDRNSQMHLWDWMFDYPDPDANAKTFAHGDSLGDDATVKLILWWSNYVNVELSHLVEEAAQELDPQKRQAMYEEITAILLEDGPIVFLLSPIHQYGVRSSIAPYLDVAEYLIYDLPLLR